MISRYSIASAGAGFSLREYEALSALRAKYQEGQDLFSEQELARLRFMRWLIHAPGWDTALDHPIPTQQQTASTAQGLPWMRGSLA